jgi:glyoxylase-like metal-dependent hydrolase (beta-lactamase superfamily II)
MGRILLFCSVSLLFVSVLSFNHVALATQDPLAVSVNGTLKIEIIKLTDKVYQHISYKEVAPYGLVAASGLVVIDGTDAHIVDTPWSNEDTLDLLAWIKLQGLTVKSAVVSHFHQDASGGMAILNKEKIPTFASAQTNALLTRQGRELSSDEFSVVRGNEVGSASTAELVPGLIEVFYPGPGHSQDNLVFWLPQSKILFGGCFVKSLASKTLGNTADANISDWPKSIDEVLTQYPQIKLVVPGHGAIGDTRLLQHTQDLARLAEK